MNAHFISDLHLQESEPHLLRLFLHYMERIAPGSERLYVLGDLFEAWVGDDDETPLHHQVIEAFRRYSDSGRPLFFLHGNRDFLLGSRFAAATGGSLLHNPVVENVAGVRTVIQHGDELCTDDVAYQTFRQQVRSPGWQQAFLSKPLAERKQIAAQMRAASRQQAKEKAEYIMDVNDGAVLETLRRHDARRLIHGHTHRPAFHRHDHDGIAAQRIVLGDWHEQGCYLSLSPADTALHYFSV